MVKIHFNGPVSVNGSLVVNGRQDVTITPSEKKGEGEKKDALQDDDTDTESEGVRRIRIVGAVVIGGRRIVHN